MPQLPAPSSHARLRHASTSLVLMLTLLICTAAAAVGIPRWCLAEEREKVSSALIYLESVRQAQISYHQETGRFTSDINQLDIRQLSPTHFSIGSMESDCGSDSWSISARRCGTRKYFGEYSLVYTHDGFDVDRSTAEPQLVTQRPSHSNQIAISR